MNIQNYDVNAIKETNTEKGLMSTFYSCRHFRAYEDGEIILYGFNGTDDDVNIYINDKNYSKVFITNSNGKTIFSKTI